MRQYHIILASLLITTFCLQAHAFELPVEIQKMIDDLGTPEKHQLNNGKRHRCIFGGTKRVTISQLGDATIISAEYDNCRESGITRDGNNEIMLQNGEVIGTSLKRSVNGELFDAARKNDTAKARELIARKADVNYSESISGENGRSIDDWTPLMWAASSGNTKIMSLLIKAGAWVNYLNGDVINALWVASASGHLDAVNLLIRNQAHVNNRNHDNVTPLMVASMGGHYDVVKRLLDAKASINLVHKEGDSALMFALARRHPKIANLLIDSGAEINIRNKHGVTAVMISVAEENDEVALKLLDKKADLTAKTHSGMTVLDIAVAKGNTKIIEHIKQLLADR